MNTGNELINTYYASECSAPSDINEHLPTLRALADQCKSVTEMGVRWVVSTWAFLNSNTESIVSIDICDPSEYRYAPEFNLRSPSDLAVIQELARAANKQYVFIKASTLQITIDPTDLLFIDTLHSYYQLKNELLLHGNQANKYIVLHDVETFKYRDEILGYTAIKTEHTGLKMAIDEFLSQNPHWKIKNWYTNNNGLCVLERK